MKVAIAQIAPVFLDKAKTLRRVVARIGEAAQQGCRLVCFGETLVPGYPVWLSRTGGAKFDDTDQKRMHGHYLREAVVPEQGDLDGVCAAAAADGIAVVLGIAEKPEDRGGHSIFCSAAHIDADGKIASIHRKLVPTYEERLAWASGDGAGLVANEVGPFKVGALNCWENWMPLARQALYAAGVDLHVMLWPGAERLTTEITRFVARESRSYVVSACGFIRENDLPTTLPMRDRIARPNEVLYDGGSCIAGPDGNWVIPPLAGREELLVAELDPTLVLQERQSFDPAGHYSRPDVLQLRVNHKRQSAVDELDDDEEAGD